MELNYIQIFFYYLFFILTIILSLFLIVGNAFEIIDQINDEQTLFNQSSILSPRQIIFDCSIGLVIFTYASMINIKSAIAKNKTTVLIVSTITWLLFFLMLYIESLFHQSC
jgi:Na+/proline symporter